MSEPDRSVFDEHAWHAFRTVNARFADHISAEAAPGATVWLHDYNLWLVPGLLRTTRPDLRTGLFHHTPFPSPEVFATLPVAAELRASLACLDWAGFHTKVFADHFRRALADADDTADAANLPDIEVHPLGIDRPAIERLAARRTPQPRPATARVVLSVERLDYAKAPVQKVDAIDLLLTHRPDLRGRFTFRLVCPPPEPGITAYDTTRRHLEQRIGQVNADWRQASWQPIDYLPRSLSGTRALSRGPQLRPGPSPHPRRTPRPHGRTRRTPRPRTPRRLGGPDRPRDPAPRSPTRPVREVSARELPGHGLRAEPTTGAC
ncbi:trehalose-6-phosphate synthase [Kitasatospora sp. NPDC008050]|uniref:trehalose-6-phosphate synthase n=1 Tax=Kitasatospora sp. NPDC008050 TaxID=3364021 RepID=UPI0036E41885